MSDMNAAGPGPTQHRPPVNPSGATPPPPPPPYPPMGYPPTPPPRGQGMLTRILTGLLGTLLLVSIILNIYLGIFVYSVTSGPAEKTYMEGDHTQRIVVLPIKGAIADDTAGFVIQALQALRKKPPKALILRINSPGGGVAASDQIFHELQRFKEDTNVPVVASFGGLAASGGYYVAMAADYIVSEPTTITGSIGVIAQAFTVEQLLEKIGVTPEITTSTNSTNKDELSPFRPWNEQDRTALRELLDTSYDRFVAVVDEGREALDDEAVRKVATGEVFTTDAALNLKLVDKLGYLSDAIDKAKELASIDAAAKPAVTVLMRQQGLLGALMKGQTTTPSLSIDADQARALVTDWLTPSFEYRWMPTR